MATFARVRKAQTGETLGHIIEFNNGDGTYSKLARATLAETIAGNDSSSFVTPSGLASYSQGSSAIDTINGGASAELNPNSYAAYILNLDQDITLTIQALAASGIHTIAVYTIQTGAGGWGVTWPSVFYWPESIEPLPDTSTGSKTLYIFTALDGTYYNGAMIGTAYG